MFLKEVVLPGTRTESVIDIYILAKGFLKMVRTCLWDVTRAFELQ